MKIPFTVEQFFGVFRDYNIAVWPAQVFLVALAVIALVLVVAPQRWSGMAVFSILAFFWARMALAYHLAFFSSITRWPMPLQESRWQAPVFFFWRGVVRRWLEFTSSAGTCTPVGHGQQPGVGAGELMRFFAEAAWCPTSLLPSRGVRWEAVDDSSAHATLVDSPLTLKLLFSFNAEGRLDTVRADARERVVDGRAVRAPWQGRFWDYAERSGMRVPLDGEVAWILPEGEKPYWRDTTTSLNYEFVK